MSRTPDSFDELQPGGLLEWAELARRDPAYRIAPPRSAWRRWGINLVFFLVTAGSIYLHGGPRLMLAVLAILVAHEMGHYLACRYYGVDATLPFFIPLPVFSLIGTLGAFIRIRSPFPHRKALFDIGIAGPLAGFVVCLPVLLAGALEARVIETPPADSTDFLSFGEPPLVRWVEAATLGEIPEGKTVLMGPLATAAWFGLFLTTLNLIPVGQLDGGHVVYALLGQRAVWISRIAFLGCLVLLYFRPTWLLWCVLLFVLGRRHPPTLDDDGPIGRGRVAVGILGAAVFALCFTPSPFIVSWDDFWQGLSLLLPAVGSLL